MVSVENAPIFIVGANRSGTTLMRLLLNAHSRIAIPDELVYIHSFVAGVPIESWRNPGLSESEYAEFVTEFVGRAVKLLPGIDDEALRQKILNGAPDLSRPYRLALSCWAAHCGKRRWGEKTPGNLFYGDILLDMFPEAQFIQMTRDPRAGVASMQKADFFSDDVVFNALAWRKQVTLGRRHFECSVPEEQRTNVRYESLVTSPEVTLRRVCEFLGENFEPEMLSFHETSARHMTQEAATGFNRAATQPVTSLYIDAWRETLSHRELAIIESVCGAEIESSGYQLENTLPHFRMRVELMVKSLYFKAQCWRHRQIRHFTVRDRLFARSRRRLKSLILLPRTRGHRCA